MSERLDSIVYCTGLWRASPYVMQDTQSAVVGQAGKLDVCQQECCACSWLQGVLIAWPPHDLWTAFAGYSYSFPFLKPASLVQTDENHVAPLYKHVFAVTAPTLAFIGLAWKSLRNVQFELQASPPNSSSFCSA